MAAFKLAEATIADVHRAFRSGGLTAKRLAGMCLERIEAYDRKGPRLNALITVNPNALKAAAALDRKFRKSGPAGPLHGIPVLLKDNVNTKDMPTTGGSKSLEGYIPPADAFIAKRLRDAGAILLAKANLHEFAVWGETVSSMLGQTLNPYDLTRTPGGSSGGTAALVAAGVVPLGHGNDGGGSIRIPASSCGLFGLKPTRGRTPAWPGPGVGVYPMAVGHAVTRTVRDSAALLDVVADRFRLQGTEKVRAIEAIETALKRGSGRLNVYRLVDEGEPELWRFSTGLHCPDSDLRYSEPIPSAFSFNSAVGACDTCRGFGRVIGVDWGLVIPNDKLTLRSGAIKPIQTPAWQEAQDDLMRHAEAAGIPRDTPWYQLTVEQKKWVIEGSPNWNGKWNQQWYGIQRFFDYLESKAYKMHIRVLLSKYRSYTPCPVCAGARLKTESLLWRIGRKEDADAVMDPPQRRAAPSNGSPLGGQRGHDSAERGGAEFQRFMPQGVQWTRAQLEALPGLCLHDLMLLPIDRLRQFFARMQLPVGDDAKGGDAQALKLLHEEITARLKYLCDVGIGYLTLDRQSRTLSGGEVQRINLTTALGTSLVNTLFVLDEPSIGLHPRDMHRITEAMLRLRDAGNTLVVVEHDPAVMLCADRIIDMGPGPGERGGQIAVLRLVIAGIDGEEHDLRRVGVKGEHHPGFHDLRVSRGEIVHPHQQKILLLGGQ